MKHYRHNPDSTSVFTLMVGFALLFAIPSWGRAQGQSSQPKEIFIKAGQTADVWLGVNVKGKVSYSIRTRDGSNLVRAWWILQPLGRVTQLGVLKGNGSLIIPSLLKGSVVEKLRASATSDTVIQVVDNAAVDQSFTFHWPSDAPNK